MSATGHAQASFLEGDLMTAFRKTVLAAQPDADIELIRHAVNVAAHCHQGQIRRSGDPYITHPVSVATVVAELGNDTQTICAAILHDTVEDTPYTFTALRRDFGAEIADLVAEQMALYQFKGSQERKIALATTAFAAADGRVVALKMADRLHNMRTLQYMPQEKQLRKARDVLHFFGPLARQLSMGTIGSELEALAFAALQRGRPMGPSRYRVIIGLDIESSTSRPNEVKAELRTMLFELFDAALHSAGSHSWHRDQFIDRGDGLLALIHPVDQVPQALFLSRVIPEFGRLLSAYNDSLPPESSPQRQMRVRVALHAGEVHYDSNGCYGEALDIACRLLDAPVLKRAFKAAPGPLILVVSGDTYHSVVRHGYDQIDDDAFHRLITEQIAGTRYAGWISQQQPD
jgi:class 3 adenylate cyclase